MKTTHRVRWRNALVRIAAILGEMEAYEINNDRITASRMDCKANQIEAIADQIESWFEYCNDNGFRGSCGCSRCISNQSQSNEPLEF